MLTILDIMVIIAAILAVQVLIYVAYILVLDQINTLYEFSVHLAAGVSGPDCTRAIERLRRIHVMRLVVWLAAWWASIVLCYTWVMLRDTAAAWDADVTVGMTVLLFALSGGVAARAWTPRGVFPSWRLRWLSLRAAQLVHKAATRRHVQHLWLLTSGRQIVAEYDWPLRLKRPSKPGAAEISELVERLQGELEAVQEPILWYGSARIVSIGEAKRIVALARSALPTCMSLEDS